MQFLYANVIRFAYADFPLYLIVSICTFPALGLLRGAQDKGPLRRPLTGFDGSRKGKLVLAGSGCKQNPKCPPKTNCANFHGSGCFLWPGNLYICLFNSPQDGNGLQNRYGPALTSKYFIDGMLSGIWLRVAIKQQIHMFQLKFSGHSSVGLLFQEGKAGPANLPPPGLAHQSFSQKNAVLRPLANAFFFSRRTSKCQITKVFATKQIFAK